MAARRWVDFIRADSELRDSFLDDLRRLKEAALAEMERAPSWEGVLEARGRKRAIDDLERLVTAQEEEERAHAIYRQAAGY